VTWLARPATTNRSTSLSSWIAATYRPSINGGYTMHRQRHDRRLDAHPSVRTAPHRFCRWKDRRRRIQAAGTGRAGVACRHQYRKASRRQGPEPPAWEANSRSWPHPARQAINVTMTYCMGSAWCGDRRPLGALRPNRHCQMVPDGEIRHCQVIPESERYGQFEGALASVRWALTRNVLTVRWFRKSGENRTALKFSRITLNQFRIGQSSIGP
jgi:hypothetical protein